MAGSLDLRDPASRDPAVVGWKAALLGRAAEAALPVLPGAVLPLELSAPAILAGAEALARGGRAAAYLASSGAPSLTDVEPPPSDGGTYVARSSTPFDDDGRWAGAFTSYLDVGPDDLPAAVRGCWSSVFARDALERCEAAGVDPATVRVAALIQPWVGFALGGTARPGPAGEGVVISAAAGGAHGVVGGGEATTFTVGADGAIDGPAEPPEPVLHAVVDLSRRAGGVTGIATIEWGWADDGVVLLQVGPAAPAPRPAPVTTLPAAGSLPYAAVGIATVVSVFRGPLAEELLLPWALGGPAPLDASPLPAPDLAAAIAEARRLADALTSTAWGGPPGDARARAAAALRGIREGSAEAIELVRGLPAVAPVEAARLVGLVRGVGEALEASGTLRAAELVWQLNDDELEAAVAGRAPSLRGGPDRWEPFLAEAAFSHGIRVDGTPITSGIGVGRLHPVSALRELGRPGPRSILAVPAPLPQLAPLLWHAAGFVAARGSAGAHLFEVAHSLGVPAVVGVDPAALGAPGSLVAVDGSAGVVASLSLDEEPA